MSDTPDTADHWDERGDELLSLSVPLADEDGVVIER
jgi:hypothetical protein